MGKIHSSNSIPSYLIQEGHQVIRLRSTLQSLMERCSHISSKLETFISDVASQKSVDSLDNSRGYVLKQPSSLSSRFAEFFYFILIINMRCYASTVYAVIMCPSVRHMPVLYQKFLMITLSINL